MAITTTAGTSTGPSKASGSKKIAGYFNLDWIYKMKGEPVKKRIGGISHWAKDPALVALFDMLEANPDKKITIELSVNRSNTEIDVDAIEY